MIAAIYALILVSSVSASGADVLVQ